jgi:hypothetical protein
LIRPAAKFLMEAIGIAVAAGAVLMGFAAWQLSSGPISLSFLTPVLERLVNSNFEYGHLTLGDTVLTWSPEKRELDIRLIDTTLYDGSKTPVVSIPEVSLDLHAGRLLQGELVPQKVEFFNVKARLIRRQGTGVQIQLLKQEDDKDVAVVPDKPIIEPIFAALTSEEGADPLFAYLTRFAITNARLEIVDMINGVTWSAPDANFVITKDELGAHGIFKAQLVTGEAKLDIALEGSLPRGAKTATVQAQGNGLVPAALGRASSVFSDLLPFDFPVNAKGDVTVSREGNILEAGLRLDAGEGTLTVPKLDAAPIKLDEAHAQIKLDSVAQHLELSSLSYRIGQNRGTFSGSADYQVAGYFDVTTSKLDLVGTDISVAVPDFFEDVATLDRVVVKGELDFENLAVQFDELALIQDAGSFTIKGSVANAPGQSPALDLTGVINQYDLPNLVAVWPIPLATGARDWVSDNLKQGVLSKGNARVVLPAGLIDKADAGAALPMDAVDFTFTVDDVTMSYLGPLPAMTKTNINGHLKGDRFDAFVKGGFIPIGDDKLTIGNGHFEASALHVTGGPGVIDMTLSGQTAKVLSYLDLEPLGFISSFGVDPKIIGGTSVVSAHIGLPLKKEVMMDDVSFNGKATVANLTWPQLVGDISAGDGNLIVDVTREGLETNGTLALNGVPAELSWAEIFESKGKPSSRIKLHTTVDDAGRKALGLSLADFMEGPATVHADLIGKGPDLISAALSVDFSETVLKQEVIGWEKPAGVFAQGTMNVDFRDPKKFSFNDFRVKGPTTHIEGRLVVDEHGDTLETILPIIRLNDETDISMSAIKQADGALHITATGPKFDARGLADTILRGENTELPMTMADELSTPIDVLKLDAKFDSALLNAGLRVSNVTLTSKLVDNTPRQLEIRGRLTADTPVTMDITPLAKDRRGLNVMTDNAGLLLKGLDVYTSIKGGKMRVQGIFDDTQPGGPLTGQIDIDNFRVVDAPVLASLLTVGSFTGIGDTLSGDGILFNKLDIPFQMTEERFILDESSRLYGPAMGISIKGQIERKKGIMDLNGTAAPAYTLNSILGAVPILGDLIVGREGEGLIGFTFAVTGPQSAPEISVNPLSALAPGFLRRLFEYSDDLPPESAPLPQPKVNTHVPAQTTPPTAPAPQTKNAPVPTAPAQ